MDNNDEFDDKNKLDNDSFAGNYNRRQLIKELTIYGIILIMCVFVIPKFVVQRTIVKGESMESTLESKDNLFVEKLSYRFTDPDRFDIVCFYPYGRSVKTEYYVKRVIGLPGETVQIINNTFYINGNPLEESFGKDNYISYYGIASEPVTLGKDEFFLVGDNRNNSFDSRYSEIGPVKKDKIDGHVVLRIYPFDKFGKVN